MTSGFATGLYSAGLQVGYCVRGPYLPLTPALLGLYTFHETPASSSSSWIVVHVQFQAKSGVAFVSVTGPPWVPAGSIVPLLAIRRFGCVGPSGTHRTA